MKRWNYIVTIETAEMGEYRHVGSAVEAMDCLMSHWTGRHGRAYQHALSVCFAVMDGERPQEASREAFIAAADDAGIFIHH